MKEYSRTQRLGEQIHRELSELLLREVKDPRVGMVTIGAVEVSSDLSSAKVYYTAMGGDATRAETQAGLNRASGFLRSQLAHRLNIRQTPILRFLFDESAERGMRLDALISAARAADDQTHRD
ncbi:MAG: 30S ribosome-binding factor RbfA [Thiotrichales bacterium]